MASASLPNDRARCQEEARMRGPDQPALRPRSQQGQSDRACAVVLSVIRLRSVLPASAGFDEVWSKHDEALFQRWAEAGDSNRFGWCTRVLRGGKRSAVRAAS